MYSKPITESPSLTTPHDEQPPSEWASSTLSAFDPGNDTLNRPVSAPETPGVSMPGSFPIPKQGLGVPDVQGVASDALKTAKEYAQFASQGAQTAVQSAGNKVGEYLPQSVASYLSSEPAGTQVEAPHLKNTLPSEETSKSYRPSTLGGVGILPGEIGVGLFPDERAGGKSVVQSVHDTSDIAKPSPISTTTNNNPVQPSSDPLARHTGYIPGILQDDTSLAKLPEERRLEKLPSHDDETGGRLGKSGGVGALPGSSNESSVALLPDERKEAQESFSGIPTGASSDASTHPLLGSIDSYTPSPLAQSHFVPQTTGREHAFSRDEEKIFGGNVKKDLDVPEAIDTVKGDNKPAYTGDSAGQDTHAVGAGSGGLAGAGSPTQMTSEIADAPKKSGFIHKVKGEMKILSGKVSHNETKIEEGRKMMGKN